MPSSNLIRSKTVEISSNGLLCAGFRNNKSVLLLFEKNPLSSYWPGRMRAYYVGTLNRIKAHLCISKHFYSLHYTPCLSVLSWKLKLFRTWVTWYRMEPLLFIVTEYRGKHLTMMILWSIEEYDIIEKQP